MAKSQIFRRKDFKWTLNSYLYHRKGILETKGNSVSCCHHKATTLWGMVRKCTENTLTLTSTHYFLQSWGPEKIFKKIKDSRSAISKAQEKDGV